MRPWRPPKPFLIHAIFPLPLHTWLSFPHPLPLTDISSLSLHHSSLCIRHFTNFHNYDALAVQAASSLPIPHLPSSHTSIYLCFFMTLNPCSFSFSPSPLCSPSRIYSPFGDIAIFAPQTIACLYLSPVGFVKIVSAATCVAFSWSYCYRVPLTWVFVPTFSALSLQSFS